MKAATFVAILFSAVVALRADTAPVRVTIEQLLAAPAEFHGRRVIVRGMWDYGFETSLLFDSQNEKKALWIDAEAQDVEKPKDKKLMLLQQLFRMRREAAATPQLSVGSVEVEFEGEFSDWRSLPDVKAQIEKLKDGETLVGGFGHLGCCQQMLRVETLLAFHCVLEAPPSSKKQEEANQSPEPTPTSVTPRADARVAPAAVVAHL